MTMTEHECPQCGYNEIGLLPSDRIPSSPIKNGALSIEEQVHILDMEISRLNEERAQLLRERNERESIVRRRLPPEILSEIFRYVCPPLDFGNRPFDTSEPASRANAPLLSDLSNREINGPYLPIILGSVCSYWRHVARSTSDLWNTIALEVRERTAASHARLMQLYITRSKRLPISIELDFRKEQRAKYAELPSNRALLLENALRPIATVLFHERARMKINTLRLNSPPCSWLPFIPSLIRLENFSLGWPFRFCIRPTESQELDLSSLPHLTHFTLSRELGVVLPWSQITNLKLLYLPVATCLEIVFQCENLRKCRIRYPYSEDHGPQAPTVLQGSEVTLPQLRFLEWPPLSAPAMRAFFQRLNLPSLRRLRWEGNGGLWGSGVRDVAFDFFARLPTTLKTLELVGEIFVISQHRDVVLRLLSTIPQLENLILNGIRSEVALGCILEVLGSDDQSSNGRPFLPNLRVLEFRNSQKCRLLPTFDFRSQLTSMLRCRYLRADSGLTIKLDEKENWSDEQKEDLRELIRNNFRLELLENGKSVGWL